MRATVLVVDDEPHIRDVVRAYLEREGYTVLTASDGEAALEIWRSESPELLVLDVMLPDQSGFDVLRQVRADGSQAGVLMLTARDDVIDRVAGIELGADDYVVKPFEPREVVARAGAILRRIARGGPVQLPDPTELHLFDLSLDAGARILRRGGDEIALTRTEFDVLVALVERQGLVWTRDQIGTRVFGEAFDSYDRSIDSHIKNLRHKLGNRPDGGAYVETVRGVGYRAASADVLPDAALAGS